MNFRSLKGLTLYLNAFFSTILLEVDGLTAPSFISTWTLMDSTDPLSTKLTIIHGLGELPVMVEVQIRSNTTGAIYPGMKSAFLSHTNTPRGGVVYNYDETSVYLYGATDYGGDPAYIIFTGSVSWTIHSQEISKIGWVRVRAWKSTNLPNPTSIDIGYVETLNIAAIRAASAFQNYYEIVHDFGIYPVLSVVQYTPSNITDPLYGIHAESQGSSSRPVGNLETTWGGLIHAVNETHIRLWAPDDLNGYLHSFCGTWGGNHSVDCAFDEATVTVKLWKTVQAPLTFNFTTMNHQGTLHPTHHYTTYPMFVFNIDTDIIVGLALVRDGPNLDFEFPGAGAAMMDDGIGVGGILYSYYEYMYELRFYHPTSTIIYMDGLANGWNTQESTVADMRFRLMMAHYVPVDYCLEQFMPDFPGQNTTGNQTFQSIQPGCLVTYECLPGYELFLGSLVLFYNQQTKLWNGSKPICQVMSTTSSTTTTVAPTTTTLAPTTTTLAPTTTTLAPTTTTLAPTTTTLAPTTTTDVTATSTDVTTTTTDVTTTTTDVITFPSSPVPINSSKCYCNNCTNISMAEIIEIAEELVVNLTVNHKNTSRYARTLVSSDDYRYSAKVIGIVGTTVCVIVATLIVLSDIASVWQPKPKGNGNGKNSQPKNV